MRSERANEPLERLSAGGLGATLECANREFERNIDESAAFRRLTARLERPPSRAARGFKLVLALGLAGALGPAIHKGLSSKSEPAITAEAVRPGSAQRVEHNEHNERRMLPTPVRSEVPPLASPARATPDPGRIAAPTGVMPEALRPGRALPRPMSPAATPAPSVAPPIEGADCLSLARSGSTRAAEACFIKRAEGVGLGAEMALYEVARLRRDVLADPSGALEALADYRRRFPAGSLRREADISQLELLMQLGRSEDALRQTQELLSSSASGERAGELHLLRGHIFRKNLRDLRAAEQEYALSERAPGPSRLEASYFRGTCLQALGENAAARAAFELYLEKGGRNYASEAKKRVEALAP